jgi:hypothetical protein
MSTLLGTFQREVDPVILPLTIRGFGVGGLQPSSILGIFATATGIRQFQDMPAFLYKEFLGGIIMQT